MKKILNIRYKFKKASVPNHSGHVPRCTTDPRGKVHCYWNVYEFVFQSKKGGLSAVLVSTSFPAICVSAHLARVSSGTILLNMLSLRSPISQVWNQVGPASLIILTAVQYLTLWTKPSISPRFPTISLIIHSPPSKPFLPGPIP